MISHFGDHLFPIFLRYGGQGVKGGASARLMDLDITELSFREVQATSPDHVGNGTEMPSSEWSDKPAIELLGLDEPGVNS